MPITYQRLGNSGGGMKLLIHALPNKKVTLSGNKYNRTLMTNENGKVIFKNLKSGTYTVKSIGMDGVSQQQTEITLIDEIKCLMPIGQIKELPLKSKLKFSNGLKMILMNKNVTGHKKNSAVLLSEFIVEDLKVVTHENREENTYKSNLFQSVLKKYFNTLTHSEQSAIILYDVSYPRAENNKITQNIYLLSIGDAGLPLAGSSSGTNIGFTDNASRIKKYENGLAGKWFTSYVYNDGSTVNYWVVKEDGSCITNGNDDITAGIVPACDISQDAYVALDSDGYYRILGM